GGALLGEKVLAYNSRVNIFIVDESKLVEVLGSRRPIPVEVLGQALRYVMDRISGMGYRVEARTSGGKAGPVVSDWGGFIIDVYTGGLTDPSLFERRVKSIPGVIETGVFIGLTDYLVIGRDGCRWEVLGVGRR
ncbi:MAG: ribose-5-phosphate isomerase A, partial [Desulfurococcales archaeon]|nr:ribose-5-phosphate isomerase A [Desulfurococcales archaeon]